MPNGDAEPVAYGRWAAAHAALESRVGALEAALAQGRSHRWTLVLTAVSGLVLPLLVIVLSVWINRALGG